MGKPAKINNLASSPLQYCCGMAELGNFNYVDPPDGKRMAHYHKVGGGWNTQRNQEPSTKEEILERMSQVHAGGIIATTGAGQEYVEPILREIGFDQVYTFVNPGHAQTPVNVWVYSKTRS